jgi:hypothetical protein
MSSLSISKVRGRALNATVQNTNNFSMWMEPLSHKQYPVTDVMNPTNKAVITSDGTRNTVIANAGLTYNNISLDISGSVNPSRWITGQTINTVFLDASDSALNHFDASVNPISSGTIATYSYTPRSTNSKIIVEYGSYYQITGNSTSETDTAQSEIKIGSITIARRIQKFPNVAGGGTRGSTIFPICGGISNNSLADRTITVVLVSSTAPIHIYKANYDAFLKVTEIAL